MLENLDTARYGIVTLSQHPTTAHLCWRTLAGARVSRYFSTLSAATAYGQYLSRTA